MEFINYNHFKNEAEQFYPEENQKYDILLSHIKNLLTPEGIAIITVPNGFVPRGGGNYQVHATNTSKQRSLGTSLATKVHRGKS